MPNRQSADRSRLSWRRLLFAVMAGWYSASVGDAWGFLHNRFGISDPWHGALLVFSVSRVFSGFFAAEIARTRKVLAASLAGMLVCLQSSIAVFLLLPAVLDGESEFSFPPMRIALEEHADLPIDNTAHEVHVDELMLVLWILASPPLAALGGYLNDLITRRTGCRETWQYTRKTGATAQIAGPWRYPVLARMWCLAGLLLVTTWVVAFFQGLDVLLSSESDSSAVSEVRSAKVGIRRSFVIGLSCFLMARRRFAKSAKDLVHDSGNPHILYLRSFADEGHQLQGIFYRLYFFLWPIETLESLVANALKSFGPLIAVGEPREEFSDQLGATRMYISDDEWQDVVTDLATNSQLVILQAGITHGLRWEFKMAVSTLSPDQFLILIPFAVRRGRAKDYSKFRQWADPCLPTSLPETIGDSFIIYFSEAWHPHLLTPRTSIDPSHRLSPILSKLAAHPRLKKRGYFSCSRIVLPVALFLVVFLLVSIVWFAMTL